VNPAREELPDRSEDQDERDPADHWVNEANKELAGNRDPSDRRDREDNLDRLAQLVSLDLGVTRVPLVLLVSADL